MVGNLSRVFFLVLNVLPFLYPQTIFTPKTIPGILNSSAILNLMFGINLYHESLSSRIFNFLQKLSDPPVENRILGESFAGDLLISKPKNWCSAVLVMNPMKYISSVHYSVWQEIPTDLSANLENSFCH